MTKKIIKNTPTPSLRDTPPRRGRNAPASEGNLPPFLSSPPWEEYGAAGRWVAPVPAGAERPGVGGELYFPVFTPLSLLPAMGATRFFYSHPPIILLLNFFGVSHKINIELTGMSVRALEKPMCFGANAS